MVSEAACRRYYASQYLKRCTPRIYLSLRAAKHAGRHAAQNMATSHGPRLAFVFSYLLFYRMSEKKCDDDDDIISALISLWARWHFSRYRHVTASRKSTTPLLPKKEWRVLMNMENLAELSAFSGQPACWPSIAQTWPCRWNHDVCLHFRRIADGKSAHYCKNFMIYVIYSHWVYTVRYHFWCPHMICWVIVSFTVPPIIAGHSLLAFILISPLLFYG